jgi:hypothetical protein
MGFPTKAKDRVGEVADLGEIDLEKDGAISKQVYCPLIVAWATKQSLILFRTWLQIHKIINNGNPSPPTVSPINSGNFADIHVKSDAKEPVRIDPEIIHFFTQREMSGDMVKKCFPELKTSEEREQVQSQFPYCNNNLQTIYDLHAFAENFIIKDLSDYCISWIAARAFGKPEEKQAVRMCASDPPPGQKVGKPLVNVPAIWRADGDIAGPQDTVVKTVTAEEIEKTKKASIEKVKTASQQKRFEKSERPGQK